MPPGYGLTEEDRTKLQALLDQAGRADSRDVQHKPAPLQGRNSQRRKVQITSTTKTAGRYPGTWYVWDGDSFATGDDCWVIDANGESLATGIYYDAERLNFAGTPSLPVFQTEVGEAGGTTVAVSPVTCVSLAPQQIFCEGDDEGTVNIVSGAFADVVTMPLTVTDDTRWAVFACLAWNVGTAQASSYIEWQLTIDSEIFQYGMATPVHPSVGGIAGTASIIGFFLKYNPGGGVVDLPECLRPGAYTIVLEAKLGLAFTGTATSLPSGTRVLVIPEPVLHRQTTPYNLVGTTAGDPVCETNPTCDCADEEEPGTGTGIGGSDISRSPLGVWTNFETADAASLETDDVTISADGVALAAVTIQGPDGLILSGCTIDGNAMTQVRSASQNLSGETQGVAIFKYYSAAGLTGPIIASYSGTDTNTYVTIHAEEVMGLPNNGTADVGAEDGANITGGGTLATGPAGTSSASPAYAFALFAIAYNAISVAWGNGFTSGGQDDDTVISASTGYRVLTSAANVNASLSISAPDTPQDALGCVEVFT